MWEQLLLFEAGIDMFLCGVRQAKPGVEFGVQTDDENKNHDRAVLLAARALEQRDMAESLKQRYETLGLEKRINQLQEVEINIITLTHASFR